MSPTSSLAYRPRTSTSLSAPIFSTRCLFEPVLLHQRRKSSFNNAIFDPRHCQRDERHRAKRVPGGRHSGDHVYWLIDEDAAAALGEKDEEEDNKHVLRKYPNLGICVRRQGGIIGSTEEADELAGSA